MKKQKHTPSYIDENKQVLKFFPTNLFDKICQFYLRVLPNHRGKHRLVNGLHRYYHGRKGTVPFYSPTLGLTLRLQANDFLVRTFLEKGIYEPLSLNRAIMIMQNGGTFIDVGANFGLYSFILSKIEKVKTIAFEPQPLAFELLLENRSLNAIDNCLLINCAIGDQTSLLNFGFPSPTNQGMFRQSASDNTSYVLPAFPLAKILESRIVEAFLSERNIKLVKIDVEGMEPAVIAGLDLENKRKPENLLIEFFPGLSAGEIIRSFRRLLDAGYEACDVTGVRIEVSDPSSMNALPEHNVWFRLVN